MIEFVGVVPIFRRITLRVAMETMCFEPSPNRFILGQLYLAFMVSIWCWRDHVIASVRRCEYRCNFFDKNCEIRD